MTLRDKVAQLVLIATYGETLSSRSSQFRKYVHAVRDLRVGGLIVVNRVVGGTVRSAEPIAMAAFLNRMQRLAKVPLIVGADFERGASMRVSGTTKFPHLMAYGAAGDLSLTRELGEATAREARALGVHWVFAPVADVNNNPDNPIINIRSFGENPADVAAHVKAFIEGAQAANQRVLLTVKHFPGHGDTSVDSHMGLPSITADRDRMNNLELVPFRAAIEARVDAVMTAHLSVPAVEKEGLPSTVSKPVLTGLLRNELKFAGLIVTDAMDMQGLTKQFPGGEAAVRAIEAGADVLLMPPNPEAAIASIVDAVHHGRISARRIDQSVNRVLAAKMRVGLQRQAIVDLDKVSDELESSDFAEQAERAAEKAVTLVKNEKTEVPLKSPEAACLFVLTESRSGLQGKKLIEEVRSRSKQMQILSLDPLISRLEIEESMAKMQNCETSIVAAFVSVAAYRGMSH
ncbi:MAG: glycoside hydrolase family 3 N-terminal domain-containing protein [Bryobacteraceae bacterium]